MDRIRERADERLSILYFLSQAAMPLTTRQIWDFFETERLIDYFTLEQHLQDLARSGLVNTHSHQNGHVYCPSPKGEEALASLKDQLLPLLIQRIDEYLRTHRNDLRRQNQLLTESIRLEDGQYLVKNRILENGIVLLEVTLHVPTREHAEALKKNWQTQAPEVYRSILNILTYEDEDA
jgi:hypothetical protein